MFNIDTAIAVWRRQLSASGALGKDDLDELESHLRDELDHQEQSGQRAEEAFHSAIAKLGHATAIQKEFTKSAGPGSGLLFRIVSLFSAVFLALVGAWTIHLFQPALWEQILGASALIIIVLYVAFLPVLGRRLFQSPGFCVVFKFLSILSVVWVVALLLSIATVDLLPASIAVQLLIWSLFAACAVTALGARSFFASSQFVIPSPILDSLSVNALQSLGAAREQAAAWNHNFVGTEHLLLGLIETSGSKIPELLKCWNLDTLKIRNEIQAITGISPSQPESAKPAPYTPRAQQVLRLAAGEATARYKQTISVEHIFLALLQEGSGLAALVLKNAGIDLQSARNQIQKPR